MAQSGRLVGAAAGAVAGATDDIADQPIRWRRGLVTLVAISGVLVGLSLFLPVLVEHELTRDQGDLRIFTYVNAEANLPTWWTVTLLLVAALLHVQAGLLARRSGVGGAGAWWVLAAVLALLSLDELTALHERLDVWGLALTDSGFAFPWLVLGAPIAIGMIAVAALAARHLPRRSIALTMGGITVLFASAVGLEALGGLLLGDQEGAYQGSHLGYTLVMHFEEFGEMAGAALSACGPLSAMRIRRNGAESSLTFRTS